MSAEPDLCRGGDQRRKADARFTGEGESVRTDKRAKGRGLICAEAETSVGREDARFAADE